MPLFGCSGQRLGLRSLHLLYSVSVPSDITSLQDFRLPKLRTSLEISPAPLVREEEVARCPAGVVVAKAHPCPLGAAYKLVPRAPCLPCFLAWVMGQPWLLALPCPHGESPWHPGPWGAVRKWCLKCQCC